MSNIFNNCTFNTSNTTHIHIDNLNVNINSKKSNSSEASGSLAIIALLGIGAFVYPTHIPLILAKMTTLIELGLILGATTSGTLAISETVSSYKSSKKDKLKALYSKHIQQKEISSNNIPVLEYDKNGLLIESNLSDTNKSHIDSIFKNRINFIKEK